MIREARSGAESERQGAERVRSFVAVLLVPAARDELLAIQKLLQARVPEGAVRWARVGQLHLTLWFLGGIPVGRLPETAARLETVAARHRPFRLALSGMGVFPALDRPRVIWAGVGGEVEALRLLQGEVARELAPMGVHAEPRPFQPHLTLGRVVRRGWGGAAAGAALALGREMEPVGWVVREVHLMRSELRPEGARYLVESTALVGSANEGGLADSPRLAGSR